MTEHASFWARRKAAVEAEALADARAIEEAEQAQRLEALDEKSDAEILEHLGLPDPQDMKAGDEFSQFMSKEVPEHLRRQALRTLWRSNPVLACVDGLNEYDDDYRAAMLLSETVKTAYQVGKGMTSHIDEMERQSKLKEIEAAQADADDVLASSDDADQADDVSVLSPQAEAEAAAPERSADAQDATLEEAVETTERDIAESVEGSDMPRPRRMRFKFEESAA